METGDVIITLFLSVIINSNNCPPLNNSRCYQQGLLPVSLIFPFCYFMLRYN